MDIGLSNSPLLSAATSPSSSLPVALQGPTTQLLRPKVNIIIPLHREGARYFQCLSCQVLQNTYLYVYNLDDQWRNTWVPNGTSLTHKTKLILEMAVCCPAKKGFGTFPLLKVTQSSQFTKCYK